MGRKAGERFACAAFQASGIRHPATCASDLGEEKLISEAGKMAQSILQNYLID
jgi:hypothetical protein